MDEAFASSEGSPKSDCSQNEGHLFLINDLSGGVESKPSHYLSG